ncbi:MAG TPA: TIGR03086 family metal-binding protein [Acidimicrobiia bacterium]|nr:TIGR03086 family metal-binding protein [Acidimicrobiia bacterium]HZQ79387.1 TIGR03086 family metal-binding protein [Acidimicrobiia bacterium]
MSDVLDRYRMLADDFGARVNAVPGDAWDNPSPCTEWTARDIVAHLTNNARRVSALANGEEAPPPVAADDPVAAWAESRAMIEAVLADPDRSGASLPGPMGPMPAETLIGRFMCTDILVHTWDLARATGLDETINAEAAEAAYEGLRPMDAMIRRPGFFGPKVDCPDDADAQTRLLTFLGRQV